MRNRRTRVETLEARQVEAERLRDQIRAEVYEEVAAAFIGVFERACGRLGLSPEQRERVPDALQAELVALTGGETAG